MQNVSLGDGEASHQAAFRAAARDDGLGHDGFAALRAAMIEGQLRTFDVTDVLVLDAFAATAREDFVDPRFRPVAYSDAVLPDLGGRRLMLAPLVLARMIQALVIKPAYRVLDVAGGAGYGASVLGALAASVILADQGSRLSPALRGNALAVSTDPAQGYPAGGPYDAILIEGVIERLPQALIDQLAQGGRLIALERNGAAVHAALYERSGDDVGRRHAFDASGHDLEEFRRPSEFAF